MDENKFLFTPQSTKTTTTIDESYLSEDEDLKIYRYRRQKYLELKSGLFNTIVNPFLMAFSAAFGMSCGYLFFDFVKNFFIKKMKLSNN
ncbi:hypothetical protein ABK040_006635 [Willaertia magna]